MDLNSRAQKHLEGLEAGHNRRRLPQNAAQQSWVDFSSNDYLGLSRHPEVIAAGQSMAARYGAGSTGSRLLSGNLPCFEQLEDQVATFKKSEASLVFSTGYQANSSALATLLSRDLNDEDPLVFTDRLIHASLHHACKLAGLKQIRFNHNDVDHLDKLLARHRERSKQPFWIVTESVFGMDGDLTDVLRLAELAERHGACIYIDEAHATGLYGPQGRGLGAISSPAIESLKARGAWVVMGTFSKAVGVSGAYLACSQPLKDYLLNRCNGFVYSTAMPPFAVGAVSKALELIPGMDTCRSALKSLSSQLRSELNELGLDTGTSQGHIVPVIVGTSEKALSLKAFLQGKGIVASAVRPPTVPPNSARLRIALNANHNSKHLDLLIAEIGNWNKDSCPV